MFAVGPNCNLSVTERIEAMRKKLFNEENYIACASQQIRGFEIFVSC